MMVSKVAVIALVAIISVPILLGYAMNLSEVTVTDYDTTGESVNVSQLLQTGTQYNYVDADIDSLNTHFLQGGFSVKSVVEPNYIKTTTRTSKPMYQFNCAAGVYDHNRTYCSAYDYYYFQSNYSGSGGKLILTIYDLNNNVFAQETDIHTYMWDKPTSKLTVTFYYPSNQYATLGSRTYNLSLDQSFAATDSGGYNSTGYLQHSNSTVTTYADFSKGYYINGLYETSNNSILNNNAVFINLPEYTRNTMLTVDLNSITASSYKFILAVDDTYRWSYLGLIKTTDSSGVHWGLYKSHTIGYDVTFDDLVADLYFDSTRSSNTYQIIMTTTGGEVRYIGNWPTLIGPANYYQTYTFKWNYNTVYDSLKNVSVSSDSPKMRIDSAEYRGFEFPVIENVTYTPASFKTNPATTISDVYTYGTSIVFGGTTYQVTDRSIMIGTHKIPINGIVFDSVPNLDGNYDNRINGDVVSTSVNPATITFNGQWSASVSTQEQVQITYTKTEWHAGEFGWNGVDHNFLMVGLLTCLGVFIALGIYARKKGSGGLIPLMIVTGCAAAVFFIML